MGTTRIDMLPDCVTHIVLSHLGFKEAARMSIISKTWLRAWLTHPNLEFRIYDFKCIKTIDEILERYREENIPIEKLSFYVSGEVFPLIDKWFRIALQNGVKYLEFGYTDYGCHFQHILLYPLPVFTILAAKSLRKLVLKDCDLMQLPLLSSGVANYCDSLRDLSLIGVRLDDNMLQTLLTTCPMIVSFTIKHCIGLEKIELRNLQKIKMVFIHIDRKQPVEIQAPTLEHLFYCGLAEKSLKLDIVACLNLKSLKLSCVKISDRFLEKVTFECQSLESLMLDNVVSKGSKKFKVCGSQSLKKLEIRGCDAIAVIDEAPNLESLEYVGCHIPVLKTGKTFGPLKHSRMELYHCSNLNALWFCKLRKFLFNSNSLFQITLHFPKCIKIDMGHWDPYRGLFTIPQVDVLNVHLAWSMECPVFMDALLWSCHPRRLNLFSTIQMITCFNNHLMRTKSSSLSSSHGSKPWQSQLVDVRVHREDLSGQPVEHNEKRRICFSLDWSKGWYGSQ
ncbi:F-box protein At5g03100-like isoform X2 [Lycium ferocissimum]|uniref:F-box protein At5g03100-like isoform X2 n=2 Tax=Lycium ferocissimum TaxID=112874 RepID=UPI0028154E2B|nr:F-box protein At5g03100-like isoform X2 [Lycium ferocissimum]